MSSSVPKEPIDVLLFRRNRDRFTDEQLEPYWGKQVAWSADGTRIVAGADTHQELYAILRGIDVDPTQVVVEFGIVSRTASSGGMGVDK
jgi:hypothetical protein